MSNPNSPDAHTDGARLRPPVTIATCALIAAATLLASSASAAPPNKVEVCHIPPDNPTGFHTIRVPEHVLSRHLAHGDFSGPCNALCATLCDDGNACTRDDTGDCEDNGCPTEPEAVDCNDGNSCTADSCDPTTGCEYVALTGTSCAVTTPSTCEKNTGVCDNAGACEPERISGCCLSTSECEAWDTNLCTHEQCIDATCETTSTVTCATDACSISVCIEATGECTSPEEILCPDPECHYNGCDPESGCYSNLIEGCCDSDLECDDGNNCTTDTCLGVDGCVSTPCAFGDACDVLVDCDPITCEPTTVPQTCEDDGDLCTAESCVEGLGCVSESVSCAEGEACNPDTGNCEQDCFSLTQHQGLGAELIPLCIQDCVNRAGCPAGICEAKGAPPYLSLTEQCIGDGDQAACEALDQLGRDSGCSSICAPVEPPPPDLLVCGGGGCFRHDSETGTQVDAFTLYDSVTHCGDTGLFPPLFDNDGILWLASKDANNSVGNRFCRYDNTGTLIPPTFTLPAAAWQGPGFIVNDWTVTHTGKIFAAVRDANINPRYVWQVVVGSAAAPPQNSLACGGNFPPNALVAAPADPADPLRESGYAVLVAGGLIELVEFDFSFSPPSCAAVAVVGDNDPATDNMSQTVAPQVSRIRLGPDGSIYLLAAHGNVYAGTDEGIWRITPARDIEQSLAMCDLLPQPCSSTTSEKPIIDFAVHPTNGNLYVLARDDAPFQLKLEVYDPQGNSLGVLYRWTDVRYSLEFFPMN